VTGAARVLALACVAGAAGFARADTALEAYKAMGLKPTEVLSGTVLSARVVPGSAKQVVALTTYFTGKKDEARGVNVRLDVYRRDGEALVSIYARDYGAENGGFVGRGELELVDLDSDGTSEIIVGYDSGKVKLVQERRGEVIVRDPSAFRVAWAGVMAYDATQAVREVPVERRDRFQRKLDIPKTLKTRGITLFFTKTMIAVAGEKLAEPQVVQETFPLRGQ
jgi:hypothetical protein